MDLDALKDSWNDVEERDGVRLSWNVFPSTRMVRTLLPVLRSRAEFSAGSIQTRRPYRRTLYPSEGEQYTLPSIRASHLQATVSSSVEPLRVSPMQPSPSTHLTSTGMSIYGRGYGSVHSVCSEIPYHLTTKIYPRRPYLPSSIPRTPRSSTNLPDPHPPRRFSYTALIHARRRTVFKR
jgi:hypothetical protein